MDRITEMRRKIRRLGNVTRAPKNCRGGIQQEASTVAKEKEAEGKQERRDSFTAQTETKRVLPSYFEREGRGKREKVRE